MVKNDKDKAKLDYLKNQTELKRWNMLKNKTRKSKSNLLKLSVAFLFPFALFGGIMTTQVSHGESENYSYEYQENVAVTNGDFTSGSIMSSSNSLSGWNVTSETESSNATGMFVDVGSGSSTAEDESNPTFSENQDRYMLIANPGTMNNSGDTRILMINSKSSQTSSNVSASKGYQSESITLEANSYYVFKVNAKVMPNGDTKYVNASIYLNGLTNSEGEEIDVGIENITSQEWKEYFFYVATGDTSQTVTIALYLGGDDGMTSSGAVFFDSVNVTRYSENAFINNCYLTGNYFGQDSGNDTNNSYIIEDDNRCFVVDALKNTSALIDTSKGYNFDFEFKDDEDDASSPNTLGEFWSIAGRDDDFDGHAYIIDIRNISPSAFKQQYGYDYIGDDLTYNNSNALILTTKGELGYVGVESSSFEIKAHTIYKISFNIKVAGMKSGSFYFKVQENDTIYSTYADVITDDEEDTSRNYLALQNGQTSGYSSNTDTPFMNDYQTVEMYVKGHSLYDTSVNFQLWLGDSETSANGAVVIDNIKVEYAGEEEFASAGNSMEFESFSSTPSTIPNSYFNDTEFSESATYPLTAVDWTSEVENEQYNQSGVIYLYNLEHYNNTYLGNYEWAGIYPGYPSDRPSIDLPNNVYMMFNSANSYQSITSSSYTLASNSYYKLSFNYYNENRYNLNNSKIKVEVVDENGIILFSQDNISSENHWSEMDIYFHTAELVSHNIQVVIHFGEEDDKVGGIVYLDNFVVSDATESDFNSPNTLYRADLSDYYLNLTENGQVSNVITSSSAYDFSVEPIYDLADEEEFAFAEGGIVSGSNNDYGQQYIINDTNYLALTTKLASRATLTSVYTVSMETENDEGNANYYKLTFDLATIFGDSALNASTDEHECEYGVTVTIDGFEPITQIVTGGQLRNFSIYLQPDKAVTPTISFTLVSDCHETLGTALITHLDFTSVTKSEYDNALLSNEFGKTIFSSAQDTASDEVPDDDTDTDTDSDNDTTAEPTSPWLLVSSIIFALAIIVAIIGFALRHVKIKKIERIRKESYDRKLSKNHDVILVEAQKRRDNEVRELQNAKKMLEEDKAQLEEQHKAFMRESRLNSKGKISKETEREIKKYNSEIIRIDEKINIISEKIDSCMSADYLLSIERRIVAEEDTQHKNDKREYKRQLKEIKNIEKQSQKDNKSQDNSQNDDQTKEKSQNNDQTKKDEE